MPALSLHPVLSLVAHASREPAAPLRILLRTTGYTLRPPHAVPYAPAAPARAVAPHHRLDIRVEARPGPLPTVVVGGFVPDATEAFYLLRGPLLRQGSVYYCNYPRRGFDLDAALAQIENLVEELAERQGRPPVVIAVSFGAGLVLELLRRRAAAGRPLSPAGVALVSPVTCVEDLLDPAAPKATTLLGRVIQPYLAAEGPPAETLVEKSRTVFLRMFEAGAQNRAALRFLLTRAETARLRAGVLAGIRAIDAAGAAARIGALRALPTPVAPQPLFAGPALVLYAEKEDAVLRADAPGRRALRDRTAAWLPQGTCAEVRHTAANPVQHASLIFHGHCFGPPLLAFYRRVRAGLAAPHAA